MVAIVGPVGPVFNSTLVQFNKYPIRISFCSFAY
jgi:hypothetical protein